MKKSKIKLEDLWRLEKKFSPQVGRPTGAANFRKFLDSEILAWAERHDIRGTPTDLRQAFEDARTMEHLDQNYEKNKRGKNSSNF